MNIFPTQYGREDGKVTALKHGNGWLLRCIFGQARFRNKVTKEWDIEFGLPEHIYPEHVALNLLSVIEPYTPPPPEAGPPATRTV